MNFDWNFQPEKTKPRRDFGQKRCVHDAAGRLRFMARHDYLEEVVERCLKIRTLNSSKFRRSLRGPCNGAGSFVVSWLRENILGT